MILMTQSELLELVEELRDMAAAAPTAKVRDALTRMADRYAARAADAGRLRLRSTDNTGAPFAQQIGNRPGARSRATRPLPDSRQRRPLPQARMREISRRTLASSSFSSRRCFTRSPTLTMPFSSLSSITGKWRIRAVVIVASTASTRSEERQLIMRVDISCWTSKLSTAAPFRAAALMKSRSENMPTGFIHRSSTIKAPMPQTGDVGGNGAAAAADRGTQTGIGNVVSTCPISGARLALDKITQPGTSLPVGFTARCAL